MMTLGSAGSVLTQAQTRSADDSKISTNFSVSPSSYNKVDSRKKDGDSPVYLYYSSATNNRYTYVYVRAYGDDTKNLTLNAKAIDTDHVTCYLGNKYLIRSNIFESKCKTATLGFKSANYIQSQTVSGKWSPDSVGSYPYAN